MFRDFIESSLSTIGMVSAQKAWFPLHFRNTKCHLFELTHEAEYCAKDSSRDPLHDPLVFVQLLLI